MIVEEKKAADNLCVRGGSTFPAGCQGSRCMAWRWADNIVKHNKLELADGKSTTHGYCGLAGRP
jgi:D-serine deaminase-like pyridoxal phosphate-dependent protein